MSRRTMRNREEDEDDEFDEYRRGPGRGPRREYDDREREFLDRSRRRDEGQYGRAYGGGVPRGRDGFDEDDYPGGGRALDERSEPRRAPMGWGRWDEDREPEPTRGGPTRRLGYWSQSRRGEYGGSSDFGRGRSEERYGRSRVEFEEDEDVGPRRRRFDDDEERFPRTRGGRRDEDDYRDRGAYTGGRHRGSNIGQSQMDYQEEDYRRGARSRSQWEDRERDFSNVGGRRGGVRGGSRLEDEDVQTAGRGGGRRGGFGSALISDLDEEDQARGSRGTGRRTIKGGRGRTTTKARISSSSKNKTGRTQTTGGQNRSRKGRKDAEQDEEATGGA